MFIILLFSVFLRFYPVLAGHFYFTVDQGRDAVFVRDVVENKKIILQGPETTIRGIFTAPGWYYFLALGYLGFAGHPAGGVVILILVNLLTQVYLYINVKREYGKRRAGLVLLTLLFSISFYDSTRYAFNPFPLVPLAIFLLVLLAKQRYWPALIPVILAFNTHLVGAAIFTLFWLIARIFKPTKLVSTALLFIVTSGIVLWLSSFIVWRQWYAIFLPPIILIFLALKLNRLGLAILLTWQIFTFVPRYFDYLKPSADPGLFSNQIKVVDWIYANANNTGFRVYDYVSTFNDYPYQYLFWWYGKQKYLPCEYSNFPNSNKDLYVPDSGKFSKPFLECPNNYFLIVESEGNGEENTNWINIFRQVTILVSETNIGKVGLEKRQATPQSVELYGHGFIDWRTFRRNNLQVDVPVYWQEEYKNNIWTFTNLDKSIIVTIKDGEINIENAWYMRQAPIIEKIRKSFVVL